MNGSFVLSAEKLDEIYGDTLIDGSYTLLIKLSYNPDAETEIIPFNFTIDRQAPPSPTQIALGDLPSTVAYTSDTTPTITGKAEVTTQVTLELGGESLGGTLSEGVWQVTTPTLADGAQQIIVRAIDAAGNVSDPINFEIQVDTLAPVLNVNSPVANTTISAGSRLQGQIVENNSGLDSFTYKFDDGNEIPIDIAADGTFDIVLDLTGLSGDRQLTLTAQDFVGNQTVEIIPVTIRTGQ